MSRRFRIDWTWFLELTPHLLGFAGAAILQSVTTGVRAGSIPAWAQPTFAVAAVALMPLCFLSGRCPSRWSKAWERHALLWLNGVMASLSGVCLGLLGVTVYAERAWRVLGGASPEELFFRAGAIGAVAGLVAYLVGHFCRRRTVRA
jgi:hypothetical protein